MAHRKMVVDGVTISDESDMYVIAEIGQNHEGDLDKCKELFDVAKAAGVNAVKLQKRDNKSLYTPSYFEAEYNSENAYAKTYGEHREFLEFGRDEYVELREYSKQIGVTMFSTAWDYKSADFLNDIEMPAFKMASGDLKTIPLLKYVASLGKPMFISTGGATMRDVIRAYDAIMPINENLCIMQCTSGYPPKFEELNIKVIETYRDRFKDIPIGFSSHDSGIAMALVGYMCGARVLEKHITLNRAAKGTDQAFSLEPNGLRRMVRDLKRARISMGDGVKKSYPSEEAPLIKMGKKIVALRDLEAGHVVSEEDIGLKSPGDGMAPYFQDAIIGQKITKSLSAQQPLDFDVFSMTEAQFNKILGET